MNTTPNHFIVSSNLHQETKTSLLIKSITNFIKERPVASIFTTLFLSYIPFHFYFNSEKEHDAAYREFLKQGQEYNKSNLDSTQKKRQKELQKNKESVQTSKSDESSSSKGNNLSNHLSHSNSSIIKEDTINNVVSDYIDSAEYEEDALDEENDTVAQSKNNRNFIGIQNQGATCYLASVLQTLYHIPYFTKRVFSIGEKNANLKTVSGQLQLLFATLFQGNVNSASTNALLKSFGWSDADAFEQHDVHELLTLLREHLRKKMRGTQATGTIDQLFMGKEVSYNKCIKVDYYTPDIESIFYDLQLQVKGCKTIEQAFKQYVTPTKLDGANGIQTDLYDKQDAYRFVELRKLPPVLMLHLMRFDYAMNPMSGMMEQRKIPDSCIFPKYLDLTPYVTVEDEFQSGFTNPKQEYYLLSVLVHRGSRINSGHYYAYVNTSDDLSNDEWYLFDDDKVSHVTKEEAIDQNYGGDKSPYMLVYVRKEEMKRIMDPVSENDIPEFITKRLESSGCTIL